MAPYHLLLVSLGYTGEEAGRGCHWKGERASGEKKRKKIIVDRTIKNKQSCNHEITLN